MKIIALLPFKNEDWVLSEYIASVKKLTNSIIAFDDNSTDGSRRLLEEAGAKIISHNYQKASGWAEHEIREQLLAEGRKSGGTHFICLDADEIFSNEFYAGANEIIASLKPGQNLWLDWITLYGGLKTERVDGVYRDLNKSFIFCDDGVSHFPYVFLGVSRIPTDPLNRLILSREQGAVIHFHYVNLQRAMMKRAWYMCSELIKGDRSAFRINVTYHLPKVETTALRRANFDISQNHFGEYDQHSDWRFAEIQQWFKKFGAKYFERLDIWGNEEFLSGFRTEVGRDPRPTRAPGWFITLNNWKNSLKNVK